jgi:hypothetical protein
MRGEVARAALAGVVLLAAGMAGVLLAQDGAPPGPGASLAGELAFSEVVLFDYDRDGTLDRVQFWVAFEARPAPGEPSPEVESGSLSYFVFDLEEKRRIDNWMMGFTMTMGGDFPRAGESYPLTNVRIEGRTARFDFKGATWTLEDGGESWKSDTIGIADHRGTRTARFYGGDVRIVGAAPTAAAPVDVPANRECNGCHKDAAGAMAASGGPHRDLDCIACHTLHPPEHAGAVPLCSPCHEGHDKAMSPASCSECHRSHAAGEVSYANTIPSAYCAACHAGAATALRASKSLHTGLGCGLCHQGVHGGEAKTCVFCHRGTHPQHVMTQPASCVKCHGSAHSIDRGQGE